MLTRTQNDYTHSMNGWSQVFTGVGSNCSRI